MPRKRQIIADLRRCYSEGVLAAEKPITGTLQVDYINPTFEDLWMGRSPVPMTPMGMPPPALTDAELKARDERRERRRASIRGIARRVFGDSPDARRQQRVLAGLESAAKTEQIEREKVQTKPPEPEPMKSMPLADAIDRAAQLDPEAKEALADVMVAMTKDKDSRKYRIIVLTDVADLSIRTEEPEVMEYRRGFREQYFGEIIRRAGGVEVKAKVKPGSAHIVEWHPDAVANQRVKNRSPFLDEGPRKKRGGL